MKKTIFVMAALLALGQMSSAAEQALTGDALPQTHKTCKEAWQKVFVNVDMTMGELISNIGTAATLATSGAVASNVSASSGTSVKITAALATSAFITALANMDPEAQFATIAAVKREALLGTGATLEMIAEHAQEEAANSTPEQVEDAVRSISDWDLAGLCTTDNNPAIFGRYYELVIGKIKRAK